MQSGLPPSRFFAPYYALIVAAGFGLLFLSTSSLHLQLWPFIFLWLALTVITDASPVNLPNGGYITVASTLDYAGILIFGPVATAWVEVLNTFFLHGVIQRKPFKRTLFNAAVFSLTILVSGALYIRLGGPVGHPPQLPRDWLPLLAMGGTYFFLNTLTVSAIIALSENKSLFRIWVENFLWTVSHMLAAVLVGLAIAVMHASLGLWGVFLFVTPLLLASYAFRLYTEMKRDIIDFVGVLSGVIDDVDPYTHKHTQRVAHYSTQIARSLQLPEHAVETIEFAALLHDLGKIKPEIKDLVLRPTRLSEEEKRRVTDHAAFGAAMAARIRSLRKTSEIVMAHHEKMDGSGYPRGLIAGAIPIGARIIAVADAFDAMTTDRIYRPAMPVHRAIEVLKSESGSHFDPAVVNCLTDLIYRGRLLPLTSETPSGDSPAERSVRAAASGEPVPATIASVV